MAVQGLVLLAAGAAAERADPRVVVASLAALALAVVPVLAARTPQRPPEASEEDPTQDGPDHRELRADAQAVRGTGRDSAG
jgi:hypothetical protein